MEISRFGKGEKLLNSPTDPSATKNGFHSGWIALGLFVLVSFGFWVATRGSGEVVGTIERLHVAASSGLTHVSRWLPFDQLGGTPDDSEKDNRSEIARSSDRLAIAKPGSAIETFRTEPAGSDAKTPGGDVGSLTSLEKRNLKSSPETKRNTGARHQLSSGTNTVSAEQPVSDRFPQSGKLTSVRGGTHRQKFQEPGTAIPSGVAQDNSVGATSETGARPDQNSKAQHTVGQRSGIEVSENGANSSGTDGAGSAFHEPGRISDQSGEAEIRNLSGDDNLSVAANDSYMASVVDGDQLLSFQPSDPAVVSGQIGSLRGELIHGELIPGPDVPHSSHEKAELKTDLRLPAFDLARVQPGGDWVIAGRGEPASKVTLRSDGDSIGEAVVSDAGDWVMVSDHPLPPGLHSVSLELNEGSAEEDVIVSEQMLKIGIDDEREVFAVALQAEGEDTRLLNRFQQEQPSSDDLAVDLAELNEAGQLFATGRGHPGSLLTLHFNDTLLGRVNVGQDGIWRANTDFTLGLRSGVLRLAERQDASGEIVRRAEAPFSLSPDTFDRIVTGSIGDTQRVSARKGRDGFNGNAATREIESGDEDVRVRSIRLGDNLWTIASNLYGDGTKYTLIYDANRKQILDPDMIYPGQVFLLPDREL